MSKLERINPQLLSSNPRASLKAWKKYEAVVVAAVRQHPKTYIFRPSSMAPITVCSRLRDAIRGKLAFDYECAHLTNDELLRWYDEVVIRYDTERVLIGTASHIEEVLQGEGEPTNKPSYSYAELSFEEVSAFALLLSTGRIHGPVHIKQPPDTTLLPARPNVELLPRPDGSLILL